ncbi:MAG: hypothetical protein PHF37_02295 [Phycisphaerae bacterium]|nr:hypothetical protein [Phycisphaerae bacterium]
MLQSLSENKVEFLVVGAYAMSVLGYPRATGDIDIWIFASAENSEKVFKSLKQFGSPLSGIDSRTFSEADVIFQIGVAPRRIDIITQIDGVDFKEAYRNREEIVIDDIRIPVISKKDLIKNKRSTGRAKDALDVKELGSA